MSSAVKYKREKVSAMDPYHVLVMTLAALGVSNKGIMNKLKIKQTKGQIYYRLNKSVEYYRAWGVIPKDDTLRSAMRNGRGQVFQLLMNYFYPCLSVRVGEMEVEAKRIGYAHIPKRPPKPVTINVRVVRALIGPPK